MSHLPQPTAQEVDQLLLNAQLRDELEPFFEESLGMVNLRRMSTPAENEFLASMLAWERAPVLPISQWFVPELQLPAPDSLDDQRLHELLWDTIHRLYDQHIVLEYTDHLSDRQLYCLIGRHILPSLEKKVALPHSRYLSWYCLDPSDDPETWLRYYATPQQRLAWTEETGQPLPPFQKRPYPRVMPHQLR